MTILKYGHFILDLYDDEVYNIRLIVAIGEARGFLSEYGNRNKARTLVKKSLDKYARRHDFPKTGDGRVGSYRAFFGSRWKQHLDSDSELFADALIRKMADWAPHTAEIEMHCRAPYESADALMPRPKPEPQREHLSPEEIEAIRRRARDIRTARRGQTKSWARAVADVLG